VSAQGEVLWSFYEHEIDLRHALVSEGRLWVLHAHGAFYGRTRGRVVVQVALQSGQREMEVPLMGAVPELDAWLGQHPRHRMVLDEEHGVGCVRVFGAGQSQAAHVIPLTALLKGHAGEQGRNG
jgi:hypothetical protein